MFDPSIKPLNQSANITGNSPQNLTRFGRLDLINSKNNLHTEELLEIAKDNFYKGVLGSHQELNESHVVSKINTVYDDSTINKINQPQFLQQIKKETNEDELAGDQGDDFECWDSDDSDLDLIDFNLSKLNESISNEKNVILIQEKKEGSAILQEIAAEGKEVLTEEKKVLAEKKESLATKTELAKLEAKVEKKNNIAKLNENQKAIANGIVHSITRIVNVMGMVIDNPKEMKREVRDYTIRNFQETKIENNPDRFIASAVALVTKFMLRGIITDKEGNTLEKEQIDQFAKQFEIEFRNFYIANSHLFRSEEKKKSEDIKKNEGFEEKTPIKKEKQHLERRKIAVNEQLNLISEDKDVDLIFNAVKLNNKKLEERKKEDLENHIKIMRRVINKEIRQTEDIQDQIKANKKTSDILIEKIKKDIWLRF